MNKIITISREYGSGGREIGRRLSEAFGIPMYDKDLIVRTAKESGFCEEIITKHEERPTNSFLYNLVMDAYSFGISGSTVDNLPIEQKVFLAQYDTIKKIAAEGPCIIVGRCADYVLEENDNVIKLFISADMKDRMARVNEGKNLSDKQLKDLIEKNDKTRASYYNYYSDKKWGNIKSYDLCINSSMLGIEETANFLIDYIKKCQ